MIETISVAVPSDEEVWSLDKQILRNSGFEIGGALPTDNIALKILSEKTKQLEKPQQTISLSHILVQELMNAQMKETEALWEAGFQSKPKKAFFEEVFFHELQHVLFRQLRGEWGNDYIKIHKKSDGQVLYPIHKINESIAQICEEQICLTAHPEWSLFVVASKIWPFWLDASERKTYRAIKALSKEYSLPAIAMLDEVSVVVKEIPGLYIVGRNECGVAIRIKENKLNSEQKTERFYQSKV
jgi:hypothetical protein